MAIAFGRGKTTLITIQLNTKLSEEDITLDLCYGLLSSGFLA